MDPSLSFALFLVLLVVVSIAIHRWWVLALPLVGVSAFYLGLRNEWWGAGVGDGWQYGAAAILLISLLACGLAVGLTRQFIRRGEPRRV